MENRTILSTLSPFSLTKQPAVRAEDYNIDESGLVLSRREDEGIIIADCYDAQGSPLPDIWVFNNVTNGNQAKLIIRAHDSVNIVRYGIKRSRSSRPAEGRLTSLGLTVKAGHDGLFFTNLFNQNGTPLGCGLHLVEARGITARIKIVASPEVSIIREELLVD